MLHVLAISWNQGMSLVSNLSAQGYQTVYSQPFYLVNFNPGIDREASSLVSLIAGDIAGQFEKRLGHDLRKY